MRPPIPRRSIGRFLQVAFVLAPVWFAVGRLGSSAIAQPISSAEPGAGYRRWPLSIPRLGKAGFTLMRPQETGVTFTNRLGQERSLTNHVLLNGSGVAAGDIDGDGRIDLYFCGLDSSNALYRNLGDWRFEDITESAGVACAGLDSTGTALADVDGDGDLDLLVNTIGHGTLLFLNDGRGHFSAVSPPLNSGNAGTSLALADFDGDGRLDLYVANYRPMFFFLDKAETRYSFRMINGQPHVVSIDGRPLTDPEFTNRFDFQVQMANGKITFGKEELGEVDMLYRNRGWGRFEHVPFTGGDFLDEERRTLKEPPRDWGLSVAFRDLNGDGLPDIYVCNDFRTPDRIWINDGHGHFRAMARLGLRQTCLSAMAIDVADINRDGFFDLLTVDMLSTDHTRRLTQRIDLRPEILLPGQIDNRPQFSRNMLQLNRGDGTFAEIAQFSGLEAAEWAWAPVFLDVDLDGYEDLLVGNGFERDTMNVDAQAQIDLLSRQQKLGAKDKMALRRLYPRLNTRNLAFRNQGNCRFENVSAAWGFDTPAISQGMCLADLDNDGDLDVIVNNMNEVAGLYRNNSNASRITVKLKGLPPNTRGIGARIEVFGGPVYQSQEMVCGGRYCSSDDAQRTFAAGAITNDLRVIVTWRGGRKTEVLHARPNYLYEIEESSATPANATAPITSIPETGGDSVNMPAGSNASERSSPPPLFRDVTEILQHRHHDDGFDDFVRQPLLPVKLSQLGPGVAWSDLDGDGWEDLVIGTGKGGALGVFRNDGRGRFNPLGGPEISERWGRDSAGIVTLSEQGQATKILVGQSNYEDASTNAAAVRLVTCAPRGQGPDLLHRLPTDERRDSISDAIPGALASTGPLALGIPDGQSNAVLFVGGRVVPGRYPEAASSRVFQLKGNRFELDSRQSDALDHVGLVTGALYTDLDGDGRPELLLACEWGPVRVFRNDHGALLEATQSLGLDRFTGWWTGIAVGDFDNDGRLDIVATNWGQNSRYEHFRSHPLALYYGNFNGEGGIQTLEAYFDPALGKVVPWRRLDDAARSLPFLNGRFESFQAFGKAGIAEILGERFAEAHRLEAVWLESTVFLNRGDHFEPILLPFEAQLAPAFGVCVGDFDGDGCEDIFLSQNFFDLPAEVSRYDAGRGSLLLGDGHGGFHAITGQMSGLTIYGEQRGAAVCDYDHDGRVDLVVTQNAAETRLFHNESARRGLRVRLRGPANNPDGVGAALRLHFAHSVGPTREIHAGSGYWSQDGTTQVLGIPEAAAFLEVRWPGGIMTQGAVPAGAREIEVDTSGKVTAVLP